MRIKTIVGIFVLIAFAVINAGLAFSQDNQALDKMSDELDEELKWLKAETFVFTASKIMEEIKKAPASVTVITARQIRQMGARNLTDVLNRAVPGISSHHNPGSWNIDIRGRGTICSNTILFMINSHPINEVNTGGATWVHDTLIVDNIERIEVLRSPGSALYGANAFYGVVNIMTKKAEDIDGLELTAKGGSWDTQQYNLLYGKGFRDLEIAFNLNYFKTNGFKGFIEEDYQTQFDQFWNSLGVPSNASLAPGRMAGNREKYDAALNLKFKGFQFDGRYVDKEWDKPIGFISALNEKSVSHIKEYYLNLSYEKSVLEGLDLFGKVYRNLHDFAWDYQYFPPGFVFMTPTGFAIWPDGLIAVGDDKYSRTGIDIQITYSMGDTHTIVAGATYEVQKGTEDVSANYLDTDNPLVLIQLPSIQKLPDDQLMDEERNFKAVFLEDIWDITHDLRLTLGARFDSYSDFGDEVSPRVGLTWEFINGYDLKLLYGHAFRAPTMAEIRLSAPGVELDPETTDTYEISLGAELTSSLSSRVTFYYREMEDYIVPTLGVAPWNWVNARDTRRDRGVEIEAKYDFGRGTWLAGHYTCHDIKNWATIHQGSIMSNIRLSRYLNFYADCRFWGGWERWVPGDDRDDPSGGATVTAHLIAKKFLKGYEGLELRGSIYNLLDKDYTTPHMGPEVPNDWPMPGRNFLIEMKYSF